MLECLLQRQSADGLLSREATADHLQQWQPYSDNSSHPAINFVLFGKTGSTSLRLWLSRNYEPLCRSFPEAYRGKQAYPANVLPSSKEPLPCARQDFVNSEMGFCDAVFKAHGRPCHHVTLLREPVARLLSDYAYFCQACSEQGRFCLRGGKLAQAAAHNAKLSRDARGIPLASTVLACPNMTVVDFAALRGNMYVDHFAVEAPAWSSGRRGIILPSPCVMRVGSSELAMALRTIQQRVTLVLFTEHLSCSLQKLSAWLQQLRAPDLGASQRGGAKGVTQANKNVHNTGIMNISQERLSLVKHILRWDSILYDKVLQGRRQGLVTGGCKL
jgi:hypothetical protein